MEATGESVRRVSDFGYNPVWSPDGEKILVATESVRLPLIRPTRSQLWTITIASGEKRLITEGDALQPVWSPVGDRIAYWGSPRGAGQGDIWTMPAGGGEAVPIATGPAMEWNPLWSPDGKYLYFSSDRGGSMNVWRVAIDNYRYTWPRWSPDGKRIAFTSNRSGSPEVWGINRDGSGLQQITQFPGAHYPTWSPDGSQMTFSTHRPKGGAFIFQSGKSWNEQTMHSLPQSDDANTAFEPWSWSPDGKRLTVLRHLADSFHSGIGVYDLETQKYDWLTDSGDFPLWLNDGRRILFVDRGKLMMIDSKSGKRWPVLSVTDEDVEIGSPGLSRDNRTIYFTFVDSKADIWLLTLEQ